MVSVYLLDVAAVIISEKMGYYIILYYNPRVD